MMNNNDTAAELLSYEELSTAAEPRLAIIWLHGLGADGHDFMPVAQAMPQTAARGIRYIFPHAPLRPVTINNGMVMRAWYDIAGADLRRDQDQAGIKASVAAVERLRDAIAARGIPHQRQILAGFSQGGVIALRTALASSKPPMAVMGLSCYLANAEDLAYWASATAKDIPIFMAHGSQDPMVAVAMGERGRDALLAANYQVEWHEYPIPHAVSPQEIVDIDGWITQQLAATGN